MKISAIVLSRVLAFVDAADLNPEGGVNPQDLIKEVGKYYRFQKVPETLEEFDIQKGITFLNGRLGKKTILAKKEVKRVTVIEKFTDVIALIEPTVKHKKLTIINADIFTWRPVKGTKYDTIYFDVWADQCISNLEQMAKLHQAFKHFKAESGWMDSWYRDSLKARRREEQRRNIW